MKKNPITLIFTFLLSSATLTMAQIPSYVPTNGLQGWWPFNCNANDESGNGHHGTVTGATLTTDRFGAANSAYNFNGASRIVTNYAGVLGTSSRSISFWYNFNTINNSNDLWILVGYGGAGQCGGGFDCISWNGVNNDIGDDIRCSVAIYNTNGGTNIWHHYVATYDISFGIYTQNVKIYDNGVLQIIPNITGLVIALNTVQNPLLQFGGDGNVPNYMNGKLDDIGFWNRVLTQSEITALYNASAGVNLSSSDTTFCETNCVDFTDVSTNNPTSWQWFFPGASPDTSTLQHPTNICYNNYGSYDVTLVACNCGGCDTLHLTNFIKCYQNPVDSIWQSNDTLYSLATNSYQWYEVSTGLISGAANQFYVITQPGNYYCVVVDSVGCIAASNAIVATGISEGTTNGFVFSAYPNPANSILNVVFNDARNLDYQIAIFNPLSQQVLSKKINGNKCIIDISNLPHGMYFARIINESSNKIMNVKFIVEH